MKGFQTVSALALATGLVAPTLAQQAKGEPGNGLAEVVVTAQFKAQSMQEAPLAITAVDAALMESRNQFTVTDVANSAPSVQLTTGGTGGGAQTASVSIRGIGTTDFQFPVEPGVGIYIDDVYYGISFGSSFDLVDLDRVEILRGPQGTLSGKNSIGGSIKLFSKKPTAESDGYVEATYGAYDRVGLRGASNFTLVDGTLFARISGMERRIDGYFKRFDYTCVTGRASPSGAFATPSSGCQIGTEGGQDIYSVRGALRWVPSDSVENNLVVDFAKDSSEATATKPLIQPAYPSGNNYLTPPESYTSYANYTGLPDTPNQYTLPAISDISSWGVSNNFEYRFSDNLSLTSITAWRHADGQNAWDPDGSPESLFANFNAFDHNQFTEELRLSGAIGKIDFTTGAYYYDARSHVGGRINVETVGLDFSFNDPFHQTSKSAFAHAVWHLTDRFNLTGGVRYTKESKTYTFTRYSSIPGIPANPGVAPLDGVKRSFSGDRVDYRVALDYEIVDNVRPYVQVATGFKGGGINPRPFFPSQAVPFEQEKVRTYEAGIKSMLFNRSLRLNGAIYQSDYDDYQAQLLNCPTLSPPGLGNVCAATQNIGNARIKGAELEAELTPFHGALINVSASYVDFKFLNVDPSSGITTSTKPQFVPKTQYSIGAQYQIDLSNGASITPRFDYNYRSSFESNAINNVPGFTFGHVDGVGLLNARLTFVTSDGAWQTALAGTNLTDKFYYQVKYDRAAAFSAVYGQPGPPREWWVSVSRKF
ncbi:MAG: TonB-dependent receptor [Gammaproteobacteria bacterium]